MQAMGIGEEMAPLYTLVSVMKPEVRGDGFSSQELFDMLRFDAAELGKT